MSRCGTGVCSEPQALFPTRPIVLPPLHPNSRGGPAPPQCGAPLSAETVGSLLTAVVQASWCRAALLSPLPHLRRQHGVPGSSSGSRQLGPGMDGCEGCRKGAGTGRVPLLSLRRREKVFVNSEPNVGRPSTDPSSVTPLSSQSLASLQPLEALRKSPSLSLCLCTFFPFSSPP